MIDISCSLKLPQEPPAIVETKRVPAYWPSSSNTSLLIVVNNLEVKHAPELPPVLHDVSFGLKRGEHIGVLGRTGMCFQLTLSINYSLWIGSVGSGKSTLVMSILRFVNSTHFALLFSLLTLGIFNFRLTQQTDVFLSTVLTFPR